MGKRKRRTTMGKRKKVTQKEIAAIEEARLAAEAARDAAPKGTGEALYDETYRRVYKEALERSS